MSIFTWLHERRLARKAKKPSSIVDFDAGSCEAIEWALWCTAMCQCDKCGTTLEIPGEFEPPWNGDVQAWAKHFAPLVREQGWSAADDGFNLWCANCRAAQKK